MQLTRFHVSAFAAVAMLGLFAAVPATTHAAALAAPLGDISIPAPASQTIEIDGRFVTVELSVSRAIGGAPIEGGNQPRTSTHVTLSVLDGGQLPEGLDAVGVRFEKLRGVGRFFFTRLDEVPSAGPPPGFELVQRDFSGDLSDRPSVQYLRAVVRLEIEGEVIKVPMGIVRVRLVLLQ